MILVEVFIRKHLKLLTYLKTLKKNMVIILNFIRKYVSI